MPKNTAGFEDFSRDDEVQIGSERGFGLVFAAVFTIIGCWPLIGGGSVRIWALAISGAFLAVALVTPRILRPLNLVWFKFGLVLHKIVNPLVMGLMFFVVITPTALIMRAVGKDPLHREFDADADSYWIERSPPGPAPDTMSNQF